MTKSKTRAGAAAAALIILFIGGLALIRGTDKTRLGTFEKQGIAKIDPGEIVQVDLGRGGDHVMLRRPGGGAWSLQKHDIPQELKDHIGAALNFASVSEPVRALGTDELKGVRFADYGLEPAAYTVALTSADGFTTTLGFGRLNPVKVSQYARIIGRPELYLLPRYVGSEWEVVADQAQRLLRSAAAQGENVHGSDQLLLSVSISQIWSVDITLNGTVHRLERDAEGDWLLRRDGQKAHAWSGTSVAEPEEARQIAAALAELEQTWVREILPRDTNADGLAEKDFSVSVLLYARDNTIPVARFEIGEATDDRSGRFVRVDAKHNLFVIPVDNAGRLADLLISLGAQKSPSP